MKSIMDKVYPKDILGIKKIGVERWLNDYYIPVTGEDFNMICKNAYNSYFQTLENYNDEVVRWIAVANMNINNSIAWYILEVIRLSKLKERVVNSFLSIGVIHFKSCFTIIIISSSHSTHE